MGLFSLAHVPMNLDYFLVHLPFPIPDFPFLRPDGLGLSVLLTSPGLLFAHPGRLARSAGLVAAGRGRRVLIPTLLYYGGGWLQYGYRYFLDSVPFVIALCGLAAVTQGADRPAMAGADRVWDRRHGLRRCTGRTSCDAASDTRRSCSPRSVAACSSSWPCHVGARRRTNTPTGWPGSDSLAGQPLYDPAATSITPFAYWYPPIVAQVMAPISAVVPSFVFFRGVDGAHARLSVVDLPGVTP